MNFISPPRLEAETPADSPGKGSSAAAPKDPAKADALSFSILEEIYSAPAPNETNSQSRLA